MNEKEVNRGNIRGLVVELIISAFVVAYTYITQPDSYLLVLTILGAFLINLLFIDSYQNYKFYVKNSKTKALIIKKPALRAVPIILLVLFLTFIVFMTTIDEFMRVEGIERLDLSSEQVRFALIVITASLIGRFIEQAISKKAFGDREAHPSIVLISPLITLVLLTFISYGLIYREVGPVVIAMVFQLVIITDYIFRRTNYTERLVNEVNRRNSS